MKKLFAIVICVLVLVSGTVSASADNVADHLRYIPTEITVTRSDVTVCGYFVNLNTEGTISNLSNYNMAVYVNNDLLVEGYFGEINRFSVYAMGTKYQTFTFEGNYNLNAGTYSCDDTVSALIECRFSYDA